ncbi:MAG: hypothetical protein RLZZ15_4193 [Verrucomicrobiota bacterium]|jgi:hypothetical protein
MARQPKLYTRLTRNASGLGVMTSLWLGPDHLMIVRSTGYTENYSRVMLRDIKGHFLTRNDRRTWFAATWAVVAGIAGIVFVVALVNRETPIGSPIFLALGVVGLVWNHLLGPGAKLFVVTGVQTLPVPSLVRLKQARRVLAKLHPLIAAAQADLVAAPPAPPPGPPVLSGP